MKCHHLSFSLSYGICGLCKKNVKKQKATVKTKMYVKKEIIQIMKAPKRLVALYELENGENFADPVIAFAIVDEGEDDEKIRYVEGMVLDEDTGSLELVTGAVNFIGMKRQ